jgi:hypothetical protein
MTHSKLLFLFVLTACSLAMSASRAEANCTCRFAGGDVKEGQTACIKTANGPSLARCEKSQNVTSWKNLNQPCPETVTLRVAKLPKRT